jgi:amino acid adenylation domain-containing protein
LISLLQEYATRQAERRGDHEALVMGEERMTYADIERCSNQIARALQELGCGRGDRVCLFVPKSPRVVTAMQGVLKADCAYVPIDIASPAPRVAKIVEAAQPTVILVASQAVELLDEVLALRPLQSVPMIACLEDERLRGDEFESALNAEDIDAFASEPLPFANSSDDMAHILFTSGSTGTPKGVVITHSNVIEFIEWARRYFGIGESDRNSGHPPLHFDLSTFDIYGAFSAGAQLHLVPAAASLLPRELARLIRDAELTQWFSVPSTMTYMAKFGVIDQGDFPALERVLWCGEVLPTPILIHWMERLPHAEFTNLYGPTEATIASSYHTVRRRPKDETEAIPIGAPCDGEDLAVLDADRKPVPAGEVGDLYIGGVGLSPGYWQDEEKTRAAFAPDPASQDGTGRIYRTGDLARVGDDGLFYFLGRADSQIKSRGYRIELGEIETALNALVELNECAVVGIDTGGFEGTAICCAYAARDGANATPAQLKEALRNVLPSYMIPTRWMPYGAALPKNVNGKIDRRALREGFQEGQERTPAPHDPATTAQRLER